MNTEQAKQIKPGDKLSFRHPRTQNVTKFVVDDVNNHSIYGIWENGERGDFFLDECNYLEVDACPNVPASIVNLLGG